MQSEKVADSAMQQAQVPSSFFFPESVAIIGASEEAGRIGSGLYKCISTGFSGRVYCVNPKHASLWGGPCYPSVAALPETVSHAVIAVPRRMVPPYLQQCADAGVRNVVVISAGFKETDSEGAELERNMGLFCRQHGISLLGPNTLGMINTAAGFNGTFLPGEIARGPVSVISQSGGVGFSLISSLRDQRCGIAKWVGIGNEAVLDAAAFLRVLAQDEDTKAIAVCFEGLRDLPGFLRLAAEVNRTKPVVLLRDGKSAVGMRAAASHTGTMAQDGAVMRGLIEQHGLLEARSGRECAIMLKALCTAPAAAGDRAAVLTNTAGPAILASDAMEPMGVRLPQPSAALQEAMDTEVGIPMRLNNPADISSNGLSPRNYGIAARRLLSSEEYDVLLGFFTLNEHLILPEQQLIDAAQLAGKPAVACFLCSAEEFLQYGRRPESFGIPCFYDPQDAACAVTAIVRYGESLRRQRAGVRPVMTENERGAAARFLEELCITRRTTLTERASRQLLRLAGAEVSLPALAATALEAAEAAAACGYPVALKLHSQTVAHKTEAGGVRLHLEDEAALTAAFDEMLPKLRRLDPDALLTVQPMQPDGFEMILGAVRSAGSGPLVMAGMGGIYSELLEDTAFRMVPMDGGEPERMLDALRCGPVLRGFRGQTLDRAGVCRLLRRLADLMEAFPQIREIDLNPCRVYGDRVALLDARVVVEPA